MVQAQYCSEWSVLRCSTLVRFLCPEIIDDILQWTRSVLHVFSNEAMLSPGLFDQRPEVIRNVRVIWKPKFRPYFYLPQSCMAQDFFNQRSGQIRSRKTVVWPWCTFPIQHIFFCLVVLFTRFKRKKKKNKQTNKQAMKHLKTNKQTKRAKTKTNKQNNS